MSVFLFPAYATAHICLLIWTLLIWQRHRSPGALIVAILAAGLWYDNSIIAIGNSIGQGMQLETLSWPRFGLHAVVTPFMIIAVRRIAATAGIDALRSMAWRLGTWIVAATMVLYGVFVDLVGLQLQPACFDGILRYTSSASPAQFCSPDQVSLPSHGPPIPSIAVDLFVIGMGVWLWRRTGWPWLFAGGIAMFIAASVPTSKYGLSASNFGEVLLTLSIVATIARFPARTPETVTST